MEFSKLKVESRKSVAESLYINRNRSRVRGMMHATQFVDKDTKQYVIYIPSLEVSAYGETVEKAMEMMKEVLMDTSRHLINLDEHAMLKELRDLGWHRRVFKKQFSRTVVDENGDLQNWNAEEESIKKVTLKAA